jgi:toxin ParE1/3/4
MHIRWTPPAATDLDNIKLYLEQNNPQFTDSTIRNIYQRIRSLKNAPQRFRLGHNPNTREMPLSPLPYVVIYRVKEDSIEIPRIYHASQDWQSQTSLN